MSARALRLLLVDDHEILRDGLKQVLSRYADLQVVGEAASIAEAAAVLAREAPDVVVLDLNLGEGDSLEWAKQALAAQPGLRVVVLTSVPDNAKVQEAMRVGVSAYLVKTSGVDELVRALHLAREGHLYLCPQVMSALLRTSSIVSEEARQKEEQEHLSAKDREIVRLVALGMRNKEIAEQLCLSAKTVETYRVRLMHRLGCDSTADLVRWAIRERLITP